MAARTPLVPVGRIESQIFLVGGYKVMPSPHLAEPCQVEPRGLVVKTFGVADVRVE